MISGWSKMTNFYGSNKRTSKNNWNHLMFCHTHGKGNTSNNPNNTSNSNITAIAGNWIEAVGTILSAIGSTPSTIFTEQTLTDFNVIGNILQAGGSAIEVESEDSLLDRVGDELQAIGNLTVVAGILNKNEQTSELLQTQGNLLQVVGGGISLNTQGRLTLLESIANTGDIIQLIGNAIQVFADSDTKEGVVMGAVGAWIQAVGAVITALATD